MHNGNSARYWPKLYIKAGAEVISLLGKYFDIKAVQKLRYSGIVYFGGKWKNKDIHEQERTGGETLQTLEVNTKLYFISRKIFIEEEKNLNKILDKNLGGRKINFQENRMHAFICGGFHFGGHKG